MTSVQRFQATGQPIPTLEMSGRWPSIQEYPTMRTMVAWRVIGIQMLNEQKTTVYLHENDALEILLGRKEPDEHKRYKEDTEACCRPVRIAI
jgi:hypothetical protein